MKFSLSVIIPTYNVEEFIEKSIRSALMQTEVTEIVIVDDGSTDSTWAILKDLKEKNPIIRIFKHNNGINKGRAATRNLGIKHASSNFIAFLDADDFYEIDRFFNDKTIFQNDNTVQGIYNAVGFKFYREIFDHEKTFFVDNTLSKVISSDELFEALISSKYGYLHLNGFTIVKQVLQEIGCFNEKLVVAEDSELFFKAALAANIVPGVLDFPLAKRGIHSANIFDKKEIYKKYNPFLYEGIIKWCINKNIDFKNIDLILKYYWIVRYREKKNIIYETIYWMGFLIRNPKILFTKLSIKYFPFIQQRKIIISKLRFK